MKNNIYCEFIYQFFCFQLQVLAVTLKKICNLVNHSYNFIQTLRHVRELIFKKNSQYIKDLFKINFTSK